MTQAQALQICPNDHPPFLELCKGHAAALAKAGMTVDTVFLGAPRGARWDAATYLDIERGTRSMIDALRRHCDGREYRLAVAHRYRAYQVVTRVRRALGSPTIATIAHEFGMFARRRRRWRQRLVANDVYFAGVSQAVVDEMRRHHSRLTRTLVLPNPADVERLDGARLPRAASRERLGIPQSAYAVGMVGRLHPEKRPLLALEAFAAAGQLPRDARLVLVGDGSLRAPLESLASALGVESRVSFTGHLPDAARYMTAFDALVFASGPTEAFGMALLEAMVAGVPVVCADMPGPRSVLGPDGMFFSGGAVAELTSALERCAGMSDEARSELCRAQRLRAEREFSLAAVAAIYRNLLSTDAARRAGGS
jgi:glycosyltransferase involved in cell wall biosynthesis